MTDQAQVGTQKPAITLPQNDVQLLLSMVQLLIEEKATAAAEKQAKLIIEQARDSSNRKINEYNEREARLKQKMCTHQKNLKSKHHVTPAAIKIDYAVSYHVYPDAEAAIRCLICGATWHKGDTTERWMKQGVLVRNWTKLGWIEALKMVKESSNTPTQSEFPVIHQAYVPLPTSNEITDEELYK